MKYELFFLSCSISVCSISSNIVSAQTIFQRTIGGTDNDYGYFVEQTSDGGYIVTGYTKSFGTGNEDIYLVKMNSLGDTLWTKVCNGAINSYERGYCVRQTADGGYVVTGTGIFSLVNPSADAFLMKTDSAGNVVWLKSYGSQLGDVGRSVIQTYDGGYIVVGETQYPNPGTYSDIFIIRTDNNGDTIWTKIIQGSLNEWGRSVLQAADGGFVVGGMTQSYGAGLADAYLFKIDQNGNLIWARTFGGTNDDYGSTCLQTMDNGYIISGTQYFVVPGGGYVVKTDSSGNMVWSKAYQSMSMGFVLQLNNGDYIMPAGIAYGPSYDISLMRTDTNGNPIWTRRIGGAMDDNLASIQLTADGGTIIAGFTLSFGAGNNDVYLIKTDSNGIAGCNDGVIVLPTVTTPPTQVSSPTPNVVPSGFAVATAAITMSSGGIVFTQCLITDITGPLTPEIETEFRIYPNPAANELYVTSYMLYEKSSIEIYDLLGQKCLAPALSKGEGVSIDVTSLRSGIYFVRVKSKDGVMTAKFVKM